MIFFFYIVSKREITEVMNNGRLEDPKRLSISAARFEFLKYKIVAEKTAIKKTGTVVGSISSIYLYGTLCMWLFIV